MFSCEIFELFKNSFSHRTPPVAASDQSYLVILSAFQALEVATGGIL